MKVSVLWLRRYVDWPGDLDVLTDRLTHTGFNLEEIIDVGSDVVVDLEVTSNRPDCLSHIGIAREISAAFDLELKLPSVDLMEGIKSVEQYCSVQVDCPELCPRYTARIIDNVKIGPSPQWLVQHLEALGLRSVNNVVDVTNFVLLEIGQPLHAFDYHKLKGGKIIVRRAGCGQQITAIDETRHELNDQRMVIADASVPVAIAGVMGGVDTEVSGGTTCVLLESAQFDPLSVRRTARALNLHSESSFRFERGVDPQVVDWASRRAAGLIQELAGGQIASGVVDVWPIQKPAATVTLKRQQIKRLLGIDLDWSRAKQILTNLGFELSQITDDQLTVVVPWHRRDVHRGVDLIEELARIEGYHKVPVSETIKIVAQGTSHLEHTTRLVGESLNACGFFETVTQTFQQDSQAQLLTDVPPERMLRVADHVSRQWNVLRCSLLGSLLAVRRTNQHAGNQQGDLYEIARVFLPADDGKMPNEQRMLGMLSCRGTRVVCGALEQVVDDMKLDKNIEFRPADRPWYQPGSGAEVLLGGQAIGHTGLISAAVQDAFDLRGAVAVAEVSFQILLDQPTQPAKYQPLPRFPAIDRDLSLIVDQQVSWQQIRDLATSVDVGQLQQVQFVDLFQGKQIPKGKKSVTLTMQFRQSDSSLTHQQADEFQSRILNVLQEKLNATLRT